MPQDVAAFGLKFEIQLDKSVTEDSNSCSHECLVSKTLWYLWSGAGLLQGFFLLCNRGCPMSCPPFPGLWCLQCCSLQKQLLFFPVSGNTLYSGHMKRQQSQLNGIVLENCPGVTVSL